MIIIQQSKIQDWVIEDSASLLRRKGSVESEVTKYTPNKTLW